MKNKLLGGLLMSAAVAFSAQDAQRMVNPFTLNDIWSLTQDECPFNKNLAIIKNGRGFVGCWGVDSKTNKLWIVIDGKNYSLSAKELDDNIDTYNALHDIPASRLMDFAKQTKPTTNAIPGTWTNFYGAGGGYLGHSVSSQ